MNNVKIYKNKSRNFKDEYKAPVPQYQELGVTPTEYKSSIIPPHSPVIKPQEPINRNREPSIRLNTAEVKQSWASLDGNIIDDNFARNQSQQLIDNNDFYTEEAFDSLEEGENHNTAQNLFSAVNELDDDSYLLLVHNEPICSGPISEIENEVRSLIFGEHSLCNGEPISEESIIVLKKIKIKVGVFLQ